MLIILYLVTAAIFLILEAIILTLVMRPLFLRHLGGQLADPIRYMPAALFYLGYVGGLVFLVSLPALKSGSAVILPALILRAMAYGTYEFTSYAIMRDWHWSMVATDVTWGAVLTALSAWGGVAVARSFGA